jgi:hypothetical protein
MPSGSRSRSHAASLAACREIATLPRRGPALRLLLGQASPALTLPFKGSTRIDRKITPLRRYYGRFYAEHLLCERDGGRYVVGVPAMECVFWEREPGTDDE